MLIFASLGLIVLYTTNLLLIFFCRSSEKSWRNQKPVTDCSGVQKLMITAPLGFSTRYISLRHRPTLSKSEESSGWRWWSTCYTGNNCQHTRCSSYYGNQKRLIIFCSITNNGGLLITWLQMTPSNCWSGKGSERILPFTSSTLVRWDVFFLACRSMPSFTSTPVTFPTNSLTAIT